MQPLEESLALKPGTSGKGKSKAGESSDTNAKRYGARRTQFSRSIRSNENNE